MQIYGYAFYKTVGRQELNDQELTTAFTIIEGILNSRPLTTTSSDPNDLSTLTPAHFMGLREDGRGSGLDLVPLPEDTYYRARLHEIQKLMDDFWTRFVRDMLVKLQKMPKLHKERSAPVPGQVVLLLEGKRRGVWPVGRILECHPSADGLVRTVKVLIYHYETDKYSEYERPIHKIIPLAFFNDAESNDKTVSKSETTIPGVHSSTSSQVGEDVEKST